MSHKKDARLTCKWINYVGYLLLVLYYCTEHGYLNHRYSHVQYVLIFHGEHSAMISTFIKLPFVIKIFVLSIFVWSFTQNCFTVSRYHNCHNLISVNMDSLCG